MSVYLFSDPHFGHENMAKKRGFSSSEEHDEFIVSNWNKTVSKRDKVFLLGDITMERRDYSILSRLNGNICVVLGNHDLPKDSVYLYKYVTQISGCIKYKGYMLTHIPIHESEVDRFKANIFGHIHENEIDDSRYFCVCAEQPHMNYTPILFEKVVSLIDSKKKKSFDVFKKFRFAKTLFNFSN